MRKYCFEVIYTLEDDIRNWLAAVKEGEFEGKKWRNGLYGFFLKEFDKISKMSAIDAEEELKKFISMRFKDIISEKKIEVEKEYSEKFLKACEYVETITNEPLVAKNVKVYLTTFPRAPYSMKEKKIYFCIFWDDAISTLLHELLHMQVIRYWRNNKNSEISKLSEKEFVYLNESLTFLLNYFTNEQFDAGYEKHLAFRNELKDYWDGGCSFEELLSFATTRIQEYSEK